MQKFLDLDYLSGLLLLALSWLGQQIAPVAPFILASFILVMTDYFTGVRAARKRDPDSVTSRGFYRSIEKCVMYSTLILLSHVMTVTFFKNIPIVGDFVPLNYFVALLIARTEFKSNVENIESITGTKLWAAITDKFPTLKK